MKRFWKILAGLVFFLASQRGQAQTLHEDISPPENSGKVVRGPSPGPAANPLAISVQGKILPEPKPTQKGPKEITHGTKEFGADRQTEWNPDYTTGADGTLRYVAVYNPSVLPFKRLTVLDRVNDSFALFQESRTLEDLPVGGEPTSQEDVFWGSIAIRLPPGKEVTLPSVAPEMRVLSYEATPSTSVVFSKDGSDNYFVRAEESDPDQTYRIVFLVAARASYFAPTLPTRSLETRELARLAKRAGASVPLLPAQVQKTTTKAHKKLGISPKTPAAVSISRLVRYFRRFEAKSPPPNSGNPYWDLFSTRAGVCRHRSYVFAVTALGLGIPARYISNEAHAFAEIWLPTGWARIDLGGAALRLEVDNATSKSVYQERSPDPFPQPKEYSENYTQLAGDIRGLSQAQKEEAEGPRAPEEDVISTSQPTTPVQYPKRSRQLAEIPEEELEGRAPIFLDIKKASQSAYRGGILSVEGVVSDEVGTGVENLRIDIWIAPAGNQGEDSILLGHSTSSQGGQFSAEVLLPANTPLQKYDVFASTPGDKRFRPGSSE